MAMTNKSTTTIKNSNNSSYNNKNGRIKLHRFPANPTRRDLWEKAVKRSVPGRKYTLWRASKTAVICSEHFALGKKTDEEGSVGYIPSLFPTHGPKLQSDDQKRRCQRFEKLQKVRHDSFSQQLQKVFLCYIFMYGVTVLRTYLNTL